MSHITCLAKCIAHAIIVVWSLSHVLLFAIPWTAACLASLSLTISQVCPSPCPFHQWCHPAISSFDTPFPSALNLSQRQGLYQWVDCLYRTVFGCTRWPKYWSFSFSISPSKEYSGLISTKIDWFDLQGTSGVFSSTTVQRHQFFGILPSLKQNSRAHQSVQ